MRKYIIQQTTEYQYEGTVIRSINQSRLQPLQDEQQSVDAFTLELEPNAETEHYQDYWGNTVHVFYFSKPHRYMRIGTKAEVTLSCRVPVSISDSDNNRAKEEWYNDRFKQTYAEYLVQTSYTELSHDQLEDLTSTLWKQSRNPYHYTEQVNQYIYDTFSYEAGTTTVHSTAADLIAGGKGVCQDFTHLMLAMCRYRGLPARYVSGYVYCGEDSAMRGDAATHAWTEVYLPGYGWIGFDPTNQKLALEQHIRIAVGRDYSDIVPVKGVYRGGSQQMNVNVSVSLLDQS